MMIYRDLSAIMQEGSIGMVRLYKGNKKEDEFEVKCSEQGHVIRMITSIIDVLLSLPPSLTHIAHHPHSVSDNP